MTVASWAFARAAKLGKPTSAEVLVERDLETKLNDGAVLLADRWYAPDTVGSAPVILMRSPYGRRQMGIFGRLFAERGYQVVIQSCRGTFGSSGPFVPFRFEEPDGVGTLEWIEAQPWYTGAIGTFGPSYLGIVQWAVADHADGHVQAMAMQVTAANARDAVVYPGGSFSMETGAVWIQQMEYQERSPLRFALVLAGTKRRLAKAYARLPLRDADLAAHGHHIDYYQEWLVHDQPDDPFWADLDFSQKLDRVPPCSHVAGWYDIFLPGQINDVVGLREAGRDARITIGPWSHMSPGAAAEGIRDALVIFDARLKGRTAPTPAPFRIHVAGTDRWVDLESWPPPAVPTRWYLQGGRGLATDRPRSGRPDRYLYDPADATPGLGGATLDPFLAGAKDQSKREQRVDVLSYSTEPLPTNVTVAGPVSADIWTRSTRPYFDVFVRLCDVDPSGKSRNVCDGILRVRPETIPPESDGVTRVRVEMWPTARTFLAGHRIRVQVSSAAHPLFARNTGSGDPLGTAVRIFPSDHEVFHDPDHPSFIELPVSTI